MGEQVDARSNGGVAQLGEHLPCKQGVASSYLAISITVNTNLPKSTLKTKHGLKKESKKIKHIEQSKEIKRRCSIATTFHITKLERLKL